jgi:hypothetical protein
LMMQLQTPALRLLVLIFSLVPSDSSDSDRAACRRLFLGVSSMPLHLASRLSVSDPPGAGGGGRQPVAAAGQQRGRLPGLHVHARDMGPIQLQWAPPDQDSEVAQWPKAHKRAVANSDAESCCELWDRRVKCLGQVPLHSEVTLVFLHVNLSACDRCACNSALRGARHQGP